MLIGSFSAVILGWGLGILGGMLGGAKSAP